MTDRRKKGQKSDIFFWFYIYSWLQPLFHLSHAWNSSVEKLFDAVFDFLKNAPEEEKVWLDFVAIGQNVNPSMGRNLALQSFISVFQSVVETCKAGTIVVIDMARCSPATRAWCL